MCLYQAIQIVVFGKIRRLDEDAEIQKPLIQPFRHILGVAAVQMVVDARILIP